MRKLSSRWPGSLAAAAFVLLQSAPAQSADPARPVARAASEASSDAAATLDPAALLLFSVSLDGLTLSEGIGAYGSIDDPLVPVGELARLLEADIDVLPSDRRIVGRLGAARQSLLVDLKTGVARIAGRDVAISAGDTAVTPTEIYLRVSTLKKLMPLEAEIAGDELLLKLHATEKFPVQGRLQRLADRAGGSRGPTADNDTFKVAQPYSLFTPPSMDVVLDAALRSGARDRAFRYDLRLAGDLLWTNFQGFVGSDEEGRATNARVLLQRRSVEGNLLGPLHARDVSLGDTYSPGLAIGPRSASGRGFSISTAPIEQTNVFNRIDLRGDLPSGYDVELYVNEVLRGGTAQAVTNTTLSVKQ